MKKKHKEARESFVQAALKHLMDNKVTCYISADKKVYTDGVGYGGYYDDAQKEFAVAFGSPNGFQLFVHEYCHFLQDLDGVFDYYNSFDVNPWAETWERLEYGRPPLIKHLRQIVAVELDCEKRVLRLNELHQFGLDEGKYIQNSNAYLKTYKYLPIMKSWPKKSFYQRKEIISQMPTKFFTIKEVFGEDKLEKIVQKYYN